MWPTEKVSQKAACSAWCPEREMAPQQVRAVAQSTLRPCNLAGPVGGGGNYRTQPEAHRTVSYRRCPSTSGSSCSRKSETREGVTVLAGLLTSESGGGRTASPQWASRSEGQLTRASLATPVLSRDVEWTHAAILP